MGDFVIFVALPEAIEWARSRWHEQRPSPTRLHTHQPQGVGLFYSRPFEAALAGSPNVVTNRPQTQTCYHPTLMPRMSPRDCPECFGLGVKESRVDRFVYPMSHALGRLHDSLGPGRQPHPYHLVVLLAENGWDARATAASVAMSWGTAEPLLLAALRRLHSFYAAGPITTHTSRIPRVDNQQAAETAA